MNYNFTNIFKKLNKGITTRIYRLTDISFDLKTWVGYIYIINNLEIERNKVIDAMKLHPISIQKYFKIYPPTTFNSLLMPYKLYPTSFNSMFDEDGNYIQYDYPTLYLNGNPQN